MHPISFGGADLKGVLSDTKQVMGSAEIRKSSLVLEGWPGTKTSFGTIHRITLGRGGQESPQKMHLRVLNLSI